MLRASIERMVAQWKLSLETQERIRPFGFLPSTEKCYFFQALPLSRECTGSVPACLGSRRSSKVAYIVFVFVHDPGGMKIWARASAAAGSGLVTPHRQLARAGGTPSFLGGAVLAVSPSWIR